MELDNLSLYWPIFSNVFKEISLSFFNGEVELPIWSWIPEESLSFPIFALAATQSHLKSIFDAELSRFFDHESQFPLKYRPHEKTIYHEQSGILCESVFYQLKIPELPCEFLLENNLEDVIRENVDLYQLAAGMNAGTKSPRSLDLPSTLFRIQGEETLFCISAIINISSNFSVLETIQQVVETWLEISAKWLFLTMFLDNSEKIRRILDGKIQYLVNQCIQCQQVVYELNTYSQAPDQEALHPIRNCEEFSGINWGKNKISSKCVLIELFKDVLDIEKDGLSDLSNIAERTDEFSLTSEQQSTNDDDFRDTFIEDKMFVYKVADKLYHTPLVIWDCLDETTEIYNIRDALLQNLKSIAAECKYLKRIANETDGMLCIEYQPTYFSADEVDFAVDNLFNPEFLQQILSSFMFSCFRLVIIGPPPISNLLARSLSSLAPPGVRSEVLYAPMFPEYVIACESTINDMERFLDLPMTNEQRSRASSLTQYENNREINLNSPVAQNSIYNSGILGESKNEEEPNIYEQYEACSCGLYQHGPALANGVKIECISCGTQFFHYLDYLECIHGSPVVVELGNGEILNFGPERQFSRRAEELLLCIYRGNESKLRNRLLEYSAKFHFDYCVEIGHKHVFRRLSSEFEYAYAYAMYVVGYLVSELLQSERTVENLEFWESERSLVRILEGIPPEQLNDFLGRAFIAKRGYELIPEADNVLQELFEAIHRDFIIFRLFSAPGESISTDVVREVDSVDIHCLNLREKQSLKGFYNKMVNLEEFSCNGEESIIQCVVQYFVESFGEILDI